MVERSDICVYVAGPYSGQTLDLAANMQRGLDVSAEVMALGYNVYSPWCDWMLAIRKQMPMERFKQNSIAWLKRSDVMLLVEFWQNSRGVIDDELPITVALNIPVLKSIEALEEWRRYQ